MGKRLVIGIIIAIIILGVAAFVYWKFTEKSYANLDDINYETDNEQVADNNTLPIDIPVTPGYARTFYDEFNYGFELPENWTVHNAGEFTLEEGVKNMDMFTKRGETTSILIIARTTNLQNLNDIKKSYQGTYGESIINEEDIKVGDLKGYEITRLDSTLKYKMVVFIVDDTLYEFDYFTSESLYPESEGIFDHVVSSFSVK
jgi:hypothetical protein